ncbi:MEKHLA domain-containing protein [Paenibacillus doosanensis]|uniref:MEKHLA domain protein n=1 Tax=Paenibacillus konkukensis TaxID=2020716 RepID=A0ABY4RT67_9BACL|nr:MULTISPECIES: MEKHLA domain-containing protein [Paenibacillus]MCS7463884.1 MEKHLA domain-containing protein [Paenibacillus doosanensis]UQZ85749.1 MEKHLA domain protein [Paenibacillus konkukensis]
MNMIQRPDRGAGATEEHARLILNSYKRLIGRDLIPVDPGSSLAEQLFESAIVVLSHGTEADPVLNYGNRAALTLWEMDWETFTQTPSRYTAEPMERSERDRFLQAVAEKGYVDHYTGIRISSGGRRFYIQQAIVWNLRDEAGRYAGQAASFGSYKDC